MKKSAIRAVADDHKYIPFPLKRSGIGNLCRCHRVAAGRQQAYNPQERHRQNQFETTHSVSVDNAAFGRNINSENLLHLRKRFVKLGCIFAAATGVVRLAAALAANNGRDGLDNFPGLNLGRKFR